MLAAFACVDFPAIADKPAAAAILAPPTRTLRREVAGSFFLFMGFLWVDLAVEYQRVPIRSRSGLALPRRDARAGGRRREVSDPIYATRRPHASPPPSPWSSGPSP